MGRLKEEIARLLSRAASALASRLRIAAGRLESIDWRSVQAERVGNMADLLYMRLPALLHEAYPDWADAPETPAIIENGSFNYFEMPDGTLPTFDFVLPELPLYVVVGGPGTGTLRDALDCGLTRAHWEAEQAKLRCLLRLVPGLSQPGKPSSPKLIVVRWDEPATKEALLDTLLQTLDA